MTGDEEYAEDVDLTVQARCAACATEIPGPAVLSFSRGEGGCPGCGRTATVYPASEYRTYLAELRATRDTQYAKYLADTRREQRRP